MRKYGIGIIVGAGLLAGLLIFGWLVGLALGVGGALVHLLLLLAPAVGVAGVVIGAVLILADRRK